MCLFSCKKKNDQSLSIEYCIKVASNKRIKNNGYEVLQRLEVFIKFRLMYEKLIQSCTNTWKDIASLKMLKMEMNEYDY